MGDFNEMFSGCGTFSAAVGAARVFCVAVVAMSGADAWARTPFECGVYKVVGHVFPSGAISAADHKGLEPLTAPSGQPAPVRAPMLLLWKGSQSELRLPLRVDPTLREELLALQTEPVLAEWEIQIDRPGMDPGSARLIRYQSLAAKEVATGPRQVKFVQRGQCRK
jgi:hypothetical protein